MIKFDPITLDAEIVKGDTGTFSIRPMDRETPLLMNGDTIFFTIKRSFLESPLLEKKISEFDDGVATIPIEPKATEDLGIGSFFYDLKLKRADGAVDTLIPNKPYARFNVKGGIKEWQN